MNTVIITGANRGIGFELVKRFLAAGHQVIAACRKPEDAQQLASLAPSSELVIHQLDVASAESVKIFLEKIGEQTVDVLINNAGIMGGDIQSIDEMDYTAWSEAFEVYTLAPFRLTTGLQKNLIKSRQPRAVTISSQMGSLSRKSKGAYAYRSSKAAVNKVMQVLASELEEAKIVVCPIHPGWVKTDMGGETADISVEESGAGLFKLIDSLTIEQTGRFWTWEGKEHPW